MAAFTDQFKVCDPFNIDFRVELSSPSAEIGHEVIGMLSGRDIHWLESIAQQNEALIRGAWSGEEYSRRSYGDVNLFRLAEPGHAWEVEAVKSERWERYAVLCLWKLADAQLWLERLPDHPDKPPSRGLLAFRYGPAGAYTIEAMRALQIAQSILADQRQISIRNSKNATRGHAGTAPKREVALLMAETKPFKSSQKAAEYVADNLLKHENPDTFFSVDAIKRWLREADWKPRHKRGHEE